MRSLKINRLLPIYISILPLKFGVDIKSSSSSKFIFQQRTKYNKANLTDLIAATGLVILLKFDPNHRFFSPWDLEIWWMTSNKANPRDLIAATGLVIFLKLDSNHRFFSPCDLEIWCMTPKNNRAPFLYYIKLCASFQIHQWIQTGARFRKRPIWVKFDDF